MPEVGCEVMVIDTNCWSIMVCTVNAICKIYKSLSLTFPDGSLGMVELEDIDPIESPEEKAARLRDEWVESVMNLTPCADPSMFLTTAQENQTKRIYDALLSGELQAPKDNK